MHYQLIRFTITILGNARHALIEQSKRSIAFTSIIKTNKNTIHFESNNNIEELINKNDLIKQINNNKVLKSKEKSYYLTYLNDLYTDYVKLTRLNHVDNHQIYIWTDANLNIKNDLNVMLILDNLNKNVNYQLLHKSILDNFDKYSHKELAYIFKLIRILSPKGSNLDSKLHAYCLTQIKKFDLNDLVNVLFAYNRYQDIPTEVLTYIGNLLLLDCDANISSQQISFQTNEIDKFEAKMRCLDVNYDYLWSKLNLFSLTKAKLETNRFNDIANKFLKNSIKSIKKNENKLYEVNYMLNLFKCCNFVDNSYQKYKASVDIISVYLNESYLNFLFKNLDLLEYKTVIVKSLKFIYLHKKLHQDHIDYLIDYFKYKLIDTQVTSVEFFNAISVLDYLIYRKTLFIPNRDYSQINPLDITLTNLYMQLAQNLFSKTQQNDFLFNFKTKIKTIHPYNLHLYIGSFRLSIILLKTDLNFAIETPYLKIIKLFKQIDYNNFIQIGYLASLFKPLAKMNYQKTRNFELELCSLIDFNQLCNSNIEGNRLYLLYYFMKNKETCVKNFDKIADVLLNHILVKKDMVKKELIPLVYLLKTNTKSLLNSHVKHEFLSVCSRVYEDFIQQIIHNWKVNETFMIYMNALLIAMLRDIFHRFGGMIDYDDKYNVLFNFAKDLVITFTPHQTKDIAINREINRQNTLCVTKRVFLLTEYMIYSNYYSLKNLDQIWNYLMNTIEFLLNINIESNDQNYHSRLKIIIGNIMVTFKLFAHFDYTISENYKSTKEKFVKLNEAFYKKFFNISLHDKVKTLYIRNLLIMDCESEYLIKDLLNKKVNLTFISVYMSLILPI